MPVGLHQATQACQDRTNQNRLYLTSNSHVLAASVELMCTRCSLSGNPKYKSSAPPLTCVTANVHWFTSTVIQTKQFLEKIKLKLNFLLSKMWLFSAGSRFQQAGPGWNATIILESNRLISLHSSLYLPRRWMWVKAAAHKLLHLQTISMEHNKGSSFQRALWMCCRDLHNDARQGTCSLLAHSTGRCTHLETLHPLWCSI